VLAIQIEVDQRGMVQDLPPRKMAAGLRLVNGNTAAYWRDEILPRAFDSGAATRRNYRPRQTATNRRKKQAAARGKAKFGGTRPLVETGDLMEAVKSPRHRIAATKTLATVYVHGPSYFREQIADEVMRIMPIEANKLERVAYAELSEFLDNLDHKTKQRFK